MVVSETTAGFIIERLELGQAVAVVAETWQQARAAQQDILTAMEEDQLEQASIRLGRIRLGEGTLHMLSLASQAHRGLSLDAIYLPGHALTARQEADLLPCLSVRGGITLRYGAGA